MAVQQTPMVLGLGPAELAIILVIVLLLFGGSRLAGLGRSSGRALKEFKEETKGLKAGDSSPAGTPPPAAGPPTGAPTAWPQQGGQQVPGSPHWEQGRSPSEPWPDTAPAQPNVPGQWPTPPQTDVSSPSYPGDVRRDS